MSQDEFVIEFGFTGIMRNREDCVLRIGIVGNNSYGKAIQQLQCQAIDMYMYDPDPALCSPQGTTLVEIERCDLIFNCISTSIDYNSYYHMDNLLQASTLIDNPYQIIYASTPIGFADSNGCGFMPECILDNKGERNVKNVMYWVFGLPSNHTEECKNRLKTLITVCHVEGSIQSSMIHWLSASEAELFHISRYAVRMAQTEMYQSLLDLAMVKGIPFENVKLILDMDPSLYGTIVPVNDIHLLYGQFQKAGVESHYLESIVSRERRPVTVAVPTTKKISLVIASTNDKLTEDVCKNLVKKDNLVILFSPTTTMLLDEDGNILQNVISKMGSFTHKQFFPHLDYIWDFSKMDLCHTSNSSVYTVRSAAAIETMNKLELVKQHNCSLTFLSDHDEIDELVQAFITQYPEYKNKVEITNVFFDKNERTEYVFKP
jgi:hypothetical protein